MRKLILFGLIFVVTLACALFVCLSFANVPAKPAAKVVWNVGEVEMAPGDWEDILVNTIKVPESATLIISVSLESEVKTNTLSMPTPLSEANAEIMVRVLVDDEDFVASPGAVAFARRFQAIVHNKTTPVPLHNAVVVLYTTAANSFDFVAQDLDHGTHDIVVQAKVVSQNMDQCPGHDPTGALIHKGSVIVERVTTDDDDDS